MARPLKKHKPIKSTFNEVLNVIASSKYKDEKKIRKSLKIKKK